jgi:hypothetical protein
MGQTQKQIETATGINQPTISRLLNSVQGDVPFSSGKRLEAYYRKQLSVSKKAA